MRAPKKNVQEDGKWYPTDEETPLNPALREKYRVVNTFCPKVLNSPIGDIDFGTLTEEQAEQLVAAGFEFLQKI